MNDTHMSHAMEFPYPMSMCKLRDLPRRQAERSPDGVLEGTPISRRQPARAVTPYWEPMRGRRRSRSPQAGREVLPVHRAPPTRLPRRRRSKISPNSIRMAFRSGRGLHRGLPRRCHGSLAYGPSVQRRTTAAMRFESPTPPETGMPTTYTASIDAISLAGDCR